MRAVSPGQSDKLVTFVALTILRVPTVDMNDKVNLSILCFFILDQIKQLEYLQYICTP